MVTDTVLWLLLLAMVGWVALGCRATRRRPVPQRLEGPRDQLDRAAKASLPPRCQAGHLTPKRRPEICGRVEPGSAAGPSELYATMDHMHLIDPKSGAVL